MYTIEINGVTNSTFNFPENRDKAMSLHAQLCAAEGAILWWLEDGSGFDASYKDRKLKFRSA